MLGIWSLLSGCAVGPNFNPPKTAVSPAFAEGSQTNLSPGQTAVTWWRGFKDPLLDSLVERAIATNQDLRIATAHIRQARALRTEAILTALPIVTANAGWTQSLSSQDSIPFPLTREQRQMGLYQLGFDATWEIDVFGGARRAIQATLANLASNVEARRAVLISVIGEVARNYFELRGAQNQLQVARNNADNQGETLDLTVARLRAGRAAELDVAQARAQLNATLAAIPLIEASIKHSIHRLSVLLSLQPAALEPELAPAAPIPAIPALVQIGNPAELLRRRPDIRAAEDSLAVATALIGIETANLFPKVTFDGNLGVSAKGLAGLFGPEGDTYSFGPNITWAALDLGRVRAAIQAARANADAQLATYEATVLTALEETENALVDFGREQARRDYLVAAVSAADAATSLADQRYKSGISDFLAVLIAQRAQLALQSQLAQSQTRTATALVAVYKALGGGWEIEQNP